MMTFLKRLGRLAVASAAFAMAACSSTGGPLGLSPAQEKAIGEQQHPQILAAFGGEIDDPQLKSYVNGVFRRLMAASDQPNADIDIFVLDSPVVNAMALPGHVYVTRGLLALANSEAELAGVLGHEIGHIFKRHTAKRVSRGNLAQLGAVAAAILTGDADTAQFAGQAAQLYLLRFSREQEYESDLIGVQLLARSGYDPLAEADFLNTLGAWSSLEARIAGVQRPPEYLNTHPNSANRVRRAAEQANVLRQSGGISDERNRNVYLSAIDGLLYGDDPVKQGFIDGRNFVHPEIGFAFTVPAGFELRNTPQAVVARAQSGAQMQFTGANYEQGPQALIAGPIAQSLKVNFPQPQRLTVDGRPAAVSQARVNTQSGAADVTVYAVQWNGAAHYVFLWVTPARQTRQYQRAISDSVQSLRAVSPRSVSVPPATRIDVITARRGDTADFLARGMAFPAYKQGRFLIINGFTDNRSVRAGERYKLVR